MYVGVMVIFRNEQIWSVKNYICRIGYDLQDSDGRNALIIDYICEEETSRRGSCINRESTPSGLQLGAQEGSNAGVDGE